jgi:hypothetical protein
VTPRAGHAPSASEPRPPLPHGAGVNSIQLDLAATRDELAGTLDDLFAKFNLRLIATSRPVVFAGLVVATTAAAVLVIATRRRGRGGRG